MNKKFISAICICFCALMVVAGSSYYIKQGDSKGEVNLKKTAEAGTEDNAAPAQNEVNKEAEKVSNIQEETTRYTGNVIDVMNDTEQETTEEPTEKMTTPQVTKAPVEANTVEGDGSLNGLSTEANAVIDSLKFTKNSKMAWPIVGNILLEYNMDNTIYFSTLNEYKTNPAMIIQGEEYAPVVAAAKGVVTELGEDDELGVYLKMAIGNDYEVTYGQIINPVVEVGETVDAEQTIACVNQPTRYYEKEGYNLYFSVTKKGKPVDPMQFLDVEE